MRHQEAAEQTAHNAGGGQAEGLDLPQPVRQPGGKNSQPMTGAKNTKMTKS